MEIQTGFGFDTFGLESANQITDGFFIITSDTQVSLSGSINVGPEVGVPYVASIRAGLAVGPTLTLNLDPSKNIDGDSSRLRLDEIGSFDELFASPNLSISTSLTSTVEILNTPITGIAFNFPELELGQFPPRQVDELVGYIEQAISLKSGLTSATVNRAGNFVRSYQFSVKSSLIK